jgi:hypothetical protein
MSIQKRRRGRPPGSGKNDSARLAEVAALILREAALKPTTAMKRIMRTRHSPESDDTLLRRLQCKWRKQGARLLAEARDRADIEHRAATVQVIDETARQLGQVGQQVNDYVRVIQGSPGVREYIEHTRLLRDQMEALRGSAAATEYVEQIRKVQKQMDAAFQVPPGVGQMVEQARALQNLPAIRQMIEQTRALQSSPAIRQMMKQARAFQNSPAARALRHAQGVTVLRLPKFS